MNDYLEFLETKAKTIIQSGFEPKELNPLLFPFQDFIVRRALKAGKYAIFADCGLGKSFMQLEWAHQVNLHTGKKVCLLAPLAVVKQTRKQAAQFNIPLEFIDTDNYEQLSNIDTSEYAGVVLDECFAPDTKIQVWRENKLHNVNIESCLIGDKVLNCTGLDTIKDVKRKKVAYAIKIKYNGQSIISSPNHPYFTQRGWVSAKDLQRKDVIIATDEAMRILRNGFSNSFCSAKQNKVLREILLSEMADDATSIFSECTQSNSCSEKRESEICMVQNARRAKGTTKDKGIESNEQPIDPSESFGHIEGDESQTFRAWGKWSRHDITTAINEGCFVRELESGTCYITGKTSKGLPNELQSRFSELRDDASYRTGWSEPLLKEGQGHKKGFETSFFRLESFEVLEQGCSELDKYRDANGALYFYDLTIERHPSFTINGGLVHNSSILKNFEGATKQLILDKFAKTPYKLACTATPSPNDPMEIGNHSEFLDVMGRNEMLAMYFVHDGGETAKWRLKGHAVETFYKWVGTWAVMLSKPSDIGFEMEGYELPALNFIEHTITTPKRDNGQLFNDVAISATNFNGELRITLLPRMELAAELVNNSKDNFIVWVKQNAEGDHIRKLIPEAVEVSGSDSPEYKAEKLLGFGENEFRVLITKTKIASFGMNYQNCHNQIFASLDFSFEALYQAIRRSYRFGQKNEVNIFIITTDTMTNVLEVIKQKETAFKKMQYELSKTINQNLNMERTIELIDGEQEVKTDLYHIHRGDCVQGLSKVESESIGFSVFSPPFADLYTYSNHIEDMGNSTDYNQFLVQFGFLVKELHRVVMSGRNVGVHCMDLPIQKGKEGFIGLRDFSGLIIKAFTDAGFIYHSRVTIWKDPVVEMQRTKALGLLHKQVKKDSTMSRVGIPDYVLIFRKDGERENPVKCTIDVDTWQKYASPVWMDIKYGNTLQYMSARDEKDEKHICPLQLDTIERLIHLYTNPNDTVLTPFMGIGSEVYQAVKMGRKGVGFELKQSYFDVAVKNCSAAAQSLNQLTLM